MNTKEMLDTLAEYQYERDVAAMQKQELIDNVLTPEIKAKIADIEAEFRLTTATVDEKIADLTEQVKQAVIAEGQSVKGNYLHAVYNKGRISWDSKTLDGLAMVIPDILKARKEGEPSISIRRI